MTTITIRVYPPTNTRFSAEAARSMIGQHTQVNGLQRSHDATITEAASIDHGAYIELTLDVDGDPTMRVEGPTVEHTPPAPVEHHRPMAPGTCMATKAGAQSVHYCWDEPGHEGKHRCGPPHHGVTWGDDTTVRLEGPTVAMTDQLHTDLDG